MRSQYGRNNVEFENTRVRFQRLSDSNIFTGWVKSFSGNQLAIRTSGQINDVGGEYLFELTGRKATMIFIAALQDLPVEEDPAKKPVRTANGAAKDEVFGFKILSDCRYGEPKESARKAVDLIRVTVSRSTGTSEFCAVDISTHGVGALTNEQYVVGEMVCLTIPALSRSITVDGEVRYSTPDKTLDGMYRTGLKLEIENRIDRAIWNMVMDAA